MRQMPYNIYQENGMNCREGHVCTGTERFYLFFETKVKSNIEFPWAWAWLMVAPDTDADITHLAKTSIMEL